MSPKHERRDGVDRRQTLGRRDIDPAVIEETTWQEACGHDRKVIALLQQGYQRFARGTIAALAVICIFVGIALWREFQLSKDNDMRVHDIQVARFQAALNACEDSNQRNKSTIDELNILIAKAVEKAAPAQKDQINASKASTILLINALAPFHTNCTATARLVVSGKRPAQ